MQRGALQLEQARAAVAQGSHPGLDTAYGQVYDELRAMAQRLLAQERSSHTLQPTALVHEVYLRLRDGELCKPVPRAHLLAFAARVMRQILIDHARQKAALKRGGDRERSPLVESRVLGADDGVAILDLQDTIEKLQALRERTAHIVEMRCFGGMTDGEIGEVLGVSRATVSTEWRFARAWLCRELGLGGAQ